MGAADFHTVADIQGTTEEVFAILKVMRTYATEKREQYREKRNCPYFTYMNISGTNESGVHKSLLDLSDDDLKDLIESKKNAVLVEAGGPYGVFNSLRHLTVFHEMAEIAPNATMSGSMSGFGPGGSNVAAFMLKDQRLYCKYATSECFEDDEDWEEDDFDEEEPDWDEEVVYDPIAKKYIKN